MSIDSFFTKVDCYLDEVAPSWRALEGLSKRASSQDQHQDSLRIIADSIDLTGDDEELRVDQNIEILSQAHHKNPLPTVIDSIDLTGDSDGAFSDEERDLTRAFWEQNQWKDQSCCICFERFSRQTYPTILSCSKRHLHPFCMNCLEQANIGGHKQCPLCCSGGNGTFQYFDLSRGEVVTVRIKQYSLSSSNWKSRSL